MQYLTRLHAFIDKIFNLLPLESCAQEIVQKNKQEFNYRHN